MTNRDRKHTILIADDEPEIVELVRVVLDWEGYAVVEAWDGEQAFARAQATVPDLILLDVRMPKMNGLEVLARLRTVPALARIPVVILSVVTSYPQAQEALHNGAVAYLPKPFELREMARLVSNILSQDAAGLEVIRKHALRSLDAER
jgi:CheY-like chemotaxis protein